MTVKMAARAGVTQSSFLLRQDEPGAIYYKKKSGSWSWFFLKDQEPIFQDQEPSQNSKKYSFHYFPVPNKDMGLLIVKLASL